MFASGHAETDRPHPDVSTGGHASPQSIDKLRRMAPWLWGQSNRATFLLETVLPLGLELELLSLMSRT